VSYGKEIISSENAVKKNQSQKLNVSERKQATTQSGNKLQCPSEMATPRRGINKKSKCDITLNIQGRGTICRTQELHPDIAKHLQDMTADCNQGPKSSKA